MQPVNNTDDGNSSESSEIDETFLITKEPNIRSSNGSVPTARLIPTAPGSITILPDPRLLPGPGTTGQDNGGQSSRWETLQKNLTLNEWMPFLTKIKKSQKNLPISIS